jgi:hypothetical protein
MWPIGRDTVGKVFHPASAFFISQPASAKPRLFVLIFSKAELCGKMGVDVMRRRRILMIDAIEFFYSAARRHTLMRSNSQGDDEWQSLISN